MSEPTSLEGDRQVEQCIYPTNECFNDAMEILGVLLTEKEVPPDQLRLVHGICLMDDGTRFAHAWVERERTCLFLGLYQGERVLCQVPRQEYYQRLRVEQRTKYTMAQAARESARTVSYGPWKAAYLALTRIPQEETL